MTQVTPSPIRRQQARARQLCHPPHLDGEWPRSAARHAILMASKHQAAGAAARGQANARD